MREIGSEYWYTEKKNREFFVSGRTALEFIIRDILLSNNIKSVLLPGYCCHTMIDPFVKHGIKIRFYDVIWENEKLVVKMPEFQKEEIFYYMKYFGFKEVVGLNLIEIKENYQIIINDRTHSWLTDSDSFVGDYSFISFRKWNGFSGIAEARKHKGEFDISPMNRFNEKYMKMRENGLALKREFIENRVGNKEEFLELFNKAEELLESDYVEYLPSYKSIFDFVSTDWETIRKVRRENAGYLINALKNIEEIQLMFSRIELDEVPLFVPIIVKNNRDNLKKHFIEKGIYCPVHWPLSNLHIGISDFSKQLYDRELSLICDQRYSRFDMDKIIESIYEYYG